MLDGFPPDTCVVVAGVTWRDYENLVDQVGEARNCRIAFDGKDIEIYPNPDLAVEVDISPLKSIVREFTPP